MQVDIDAEIIINTRAGLLATRRTLLAATKATMASITTLNLAIGLDAGNVVDLPREIERRQPPPVRLAGSPLSPEAALKSSWDTRIGARDHEGCVEADRRGKRYQL